MLTDPAKKALVDFIRAKLSGGKSFDPGILAADANIALVAGPELVTFQDVQRALKTVNGKDEGEVMAKKGKFSEDQKEIIRLFLKENPDMNGAEAAKQLSEHEEFEGVTVEPHNIWAFRKEMGGTPPKSGETKVVRRRGPRKTVAEKSAREVASVAEEPTFAGLEEKIAEVVEYADRLKAAQKRKVEALFLA